MNNFLFWRGTAAGLGNKIILCCMLFCIVTALAGAGVGYSLGSGMLHLDAYLLGTACVAGFVFMLFLVGAWVRMAVCNPLAALFMASMEACENGCVYNFSMCSNCFCTKFSSLLGQVFLRAREYKDEIEDIKKEALKESRTAARALRKAEKEAERASRSRAEAFVQAAETLQEIASGLNGNSDRLVSLMGDVSKGAVGQKDDLGTATYAMEEISIAAKDISITTHMTAENAKGAISVAEQSADVVSKNLEAVEHMKSSHFELQGNMHELSMQASKITNVIELIEDVADQTNLLALNAAIEAARAGDAGRGFAVVADEVRKLAERTVNATTDVRKIVFSIGDVIKENVACVEQTSSMLEEVHELSRKSGDSLREIVVLAEDVSAKNQNIAAAVEQQVAASHRMGTLVQDINGVSQHTVDITSQASDVMGYVSSHTKTLCSVIEEFHRQGELPLSVAA